MPDIAITEAMMQRDMFETLYKMFDLHVKAGDEPIAIALPDFIIASDLLEGLKVISAYAKEGTIDNSDERIAEAKKVFQNRLSFSDASIAFVKYSKCDSEVSRKIFDVEKQMLVNKAERDVQVGYPSLELSDQEALYNVFNIYAKEWSQGNSNDAIRKASDKCVNIAMAFVS